MEQVRKLEKKLNDLYKGAPHLPKEAQHWLADNVWWLALLGAILSLLGLLFIIPLLLAAFALTTVVSPIAGYGYYSDPVGLGWLAVVVSIVSYIVTAVLLALAVNPLKVKAKKGWEFVFLSYVVNFGLSIVVAVLSFNLGSVLGSVVGAVIGGYFLFEIYSYFGAKVKAEPKVAAKTKKA